MSHTNFDAENMLDAYIHDYLVKKNRYTSARAFEAEVKFSSDAAAIDAPGGFLAEWWSVFWDIFITRTNEKHSEAAAAYIEAQRVKACELQQRQRQQQYQHLQQQMLQRHEQQQQQQQQQRWREGPHLLNGAANEFVGNDPFMRQNLGTANPMAMKIDEERLKLPPLQSDPLDDSSLRQRFGNNVGQHLDPNHASMLKTTMTPGQPSGI